MASPLLVFVNGVSGSHMAPHLLDEFANDHSISFVRLPDDVPTWTQVHAHVLTDPTLRLVACGGDGTVNWVVSLLNAFYGAGDPEGRPPLAILPYGSGNDMSRSLGWGRVINRSAQDYFTNIRSAVRIENADVWKVEVYRTDTNDMWSLFMANYFSLGPDAETAYDFDECRNGKCKPCFCCGCISLACYVPVALGNLCGKRGLGTYTDITVYNQGPDEATMRTQLQPQGRDKTLIVQTIPSMYAGRDPWTAGTPRAMNDRRFEVTFQGGLWSIGFFQIGIDTGRPQCQGSTLKIETSEPCFVQIDGEGRFVNGPARITIDRAGSYPLIFRR
jgi:diacylglycerol kinase (ATP)